GDAGQVPNEDGSVEAARDQPSPVVRKRNTVHRVFMPLEGVDLPAVAHIPELNKAIFLPRQPAAVWREAQVRVSIRRLFVDARAFLSRGQFPEESRFRIRFAGDSQGPSIR